MLTRPFNSILSSRTNSSTVRRTFSRIATLSTWSVRARRLKNYRKCRLQSLRKINEISGATPSNCRSRTSPRSTAARDVSIGTWVLNAALSAALPCFIARIVTSRLFRIAWFIQLKRNLKVGVSLPESLFLKTRLWCNMLVKSLMLTQTLVRSVFSVTKIRHAPIWWESKTTRSSTPPTRETSPDLLITVVTQIAKHENGQFWTRSASASSPWKIFRKMRSWHLITSLISSKRLVLNAIAVQQNARDTWG